jgi:hypothetical protein
MQLAVYGSTLMLPVVVSSKRVHIQQQPPYIIKTIITVPTSIGIISIHPISSPIASQLLPTLYHHDRIVATLG